jgi:hypothetical protein
MKEYNQSFSEANRCTTLQENLITAAKDAELQERHLHIYNTKREITT